MQRFEARLEAWSKQQTTDTTVLLRLAGWLALRLTYSTDSVGRKCGMSVLETVLERASLQQSYASLRLAIIANL